MADPHVALMDRVWELCGSRKHKAVGGKDQAKKKEKLRNSSEGTMKWFWSRDKGATNLSLDRKFNYSGKRNCFHCMAQWRI